MSLKCVFNVNIEILIIILKNNKITSISQGYSSRRRQQQQQKIILKDNIELYVDYTKSKSNFT
jgi:hypothetical protein